MPHWDLYEWFGTPYHSIAKTINILPTPWLHWFCSAWFRFTVILKQIRTNEPKRTSTKSKCKNTFTDLTNLDWQLALYSLLLLLLLLAFFIYCRFFRYLCLNCLLLELVAARSFVRPIRQPQGQFRFMVPVRFHFGCSHFRQSFSFN